METENQSSFILPMPQDFPSGIADEDTVIPFIEDTVTPMTIDSSAPGDVLELRDDFDFDGYQVVRREFFAHTFEPSITFNNYKVYVNAACLNKFPHADCVQLLINRESRILALRPCTEFERDAFAWCNTSGGKRKPRQVTGKFFFAKLFELMDWNIDYRYKLLGKVIHANDEYLIAFDLNASEIYQRIAKDGGKPKTARTPVFPAGWKDQFGLPYPHRTVLSRPRAAAHHRRDGFSVRHRAGVHRVFDRRILQALGAQKKRHEGRLDHAV